MTPAEFYASPLHHPGLLLGGAALSAVVLAVKTRGDRPWGSAFLRGWAWVFTAEILLDAALTSNASPLRPWPGVERAFAIAFVILGDLRAFALLDRFSRPDRPLAASMARAVAWAFAASLAVAAATQLWPAAFANPRRTFLLYEDLSLALFTARFLALRAAPVEEDVRRWLRAVAGYFVVQYALWAAADAMILAGFEPAYYLRVLPNLLYYVGFVTFATLRAPARMRR